MPAPTISQRWVPLVSATSVTILQVPKSIAAMVDFITKHTPVRQESAAGFRPSANTRMLPETLRPGIACGKTSTQSTIIYCNRFGRNSQAYSSFFFTFLRIRL